MTTPLTIVASFRTRPGAEDRVRRSLVEMIRPSLAEDGCLAYRPYVDATDPTHLVLVEQWTDRAALDEHFRTPHFARVSAVLDETLAEPFELEELGAYRAPAPTT